MDALKFRLVHCATFYNGQIKDTFECPMLLKEVIHKGSISYYLILAQIVIPWGEGGSLFNILFLFML